MNRDLGEGGSRTPRQERSPASEAGRGFARKWQSRRRRARSQRQTASIPREQKHASNDVRCQDTERCEVRRKVVAFPDLRGTSSVILMTRTRVDCQSSSEAGDVLVRPTYPTWRLNSNMWIAMGCYVTDHAQQWVAVCFQKNTRFQKSRSICTSSADLESTGDRVTAASDGLSQTWSDKLRAGRQIAVWM